MSDESPIIDIDEGVQEGTPEGGAPAEPGPLVVAHEVLPDTLLIVPLYERPLFPKMMGPLLVTDEELKKALLKELDESHRHLGLLMVRARLEPADRRVESSQDLHRVGVVAQVAHVAPPRPGQPLQMVVQVLRRFNVQEFVSEPPVLRARVEHVQEARFETNDELKAYSVAIIDAIKELVQLNPLYKEGLSLILDQIDVHDPAALADFAASMTTASRDELQEVLETRSVRRRIEEALLLLKKEIDISRLKVELSKRIEERLSKQQREFFLREQLKEIKKELGLSKEDAQTEVDRFQARLAKLALPSEAKERVDEELEKLKLLEPSSPEFGVTRGYLDWLTVLPWGVYTEDNYDLKHAAEILDQDHYGLSDVKDRILELISVGIVKGDLAGSIILLVGPPGVGKTSIGQSIARSLGRRFYRFSLGGMRDEAEIKGHRRTYIGALPGKFIQAIKACKKANPLIMLDEVDKIGASFRGDPASALLEVLDPEQNRDFLDHYLDVRFDLSKVLFVCTANQLETIPRPLLDRMETIRISGYILEEKLEIARRHLLPKQLREHGLKPGQVTIPQEVVHAVIDGWAREAGVRGLENNLKKLLRKAAKRMVEAKAKKVRVTVDSLPKQLGRRVFAEEKVFGQPRVGVVMGLAYTALGGATLYIEAMPVPAKGPGFKQTGQLGKVMVESAEIAYTYVRSLLKGDEAARELFQKHLIHLHVPAGATPKDGPSAGITMACALYSLARSLPPRDGLAMTGELTLSGLVMPIGGVKEKVIAAKRVKVSHLVLPKENQPDFEDLPDHVREGITPHFVARFDQVLKVAFGAPRRRSARVAVKG
jgi:ATP-dependent Lon protease